MGQAEDDYPNEIDDWLDVPDMHTGSVAICREKSTLLSRGLALAATGAQKAPRIGHLLLCVRVGRPVMPHFASSSKGSLSLPSLRH